MNLSLIDELLNIEKYTEHFHISDAEGTEGEGTTIWRRQFTF